MNNTISENTKVALLLTSFFNSNELRQYKPLTPNGYGYFAFWLRAYKYELADLLQQDKLSTILAHWSQADSHPIIKKNIALHSLDRTIADITPTRIQTLLGRGASLSMALDKWTAAGIWILARSDNNYPKKIKQALKHQSPAILFGIGNVELLAKPAIGFVGSRNCEMQDQAATAHYVNAINQNGFQVVSGAAKGVDSHAMLASLENGYSSIGIVADSLYKASVNKQWRDHLKNEKLTLITPFWPESKFSTADAMARNKFIYLLSSATVVIRSGDTGGTWKGAEENLKKGWVPLMVSEHKTPNYAANQELLDGQIKNAKLSTQKIVPSLSTDDFIVLLNAGQSQMLSQQIEMPAQSGDLSFSKSPTQENHQEYPQRPVSSISNCYANKDEIDVSTMASLDKCKTSENLASAEVIEKPTVEPAVGSGAVEGVVNETVKQTSTEMLINENSANENKSNHSETNNAESKSKNNHTKLPIIPSDKPTLSPILTAFYTQITKLIESQPNQLITYLELENAFPEFAIINKQALNKWIKHLIEQGYLEKPQRKKEYRITN